MYTMSLDGLTERVTSRAQHNSIVSSNNTRTVNIVAQARTSGSSDAKIDQPPALRLHQQKAVVCTATCSDVLGDGDG